MIALLDADIISYSCAAYNNDFGWDACREDIDALMNRILTTTGATDYKAYITGDNNFRYQVDSDYKANRKGKVDPVYRGDANQYLVEHYGAHVTDGTEADDGIGIEATRHAIGEFIIASIDKDLRTIPGLHYNWRKNILDEVSPVEALRNFYRQFLIGDTSDNIIGAKGIGQVKASRIIDSLETELDMFMAVQSLYDSDERLLKNGRLLYLLRSEDDDWTNKYKELRAKAEEADEADWPIQE